MTTFIMDPSLQLTAAFISLTYIRNRRGPSIDPCGKNG